MSTETIVMKNRYEAEKLTPQTLVHDTEVLTQKAKIVINFLEKWGMVQGKNAGEDSAGRAKLALMSPEETVDRAVEMVDRAFSALEKKGWLEHTPEYAKIEREVKEVAEKERLIEDHVKGKMMLHELEKALAPGA